MPKKKETGGRPQAANARTAIVLEIMDDMAILLPPIETTNKEGFEVVHHPVALQDLWKVANEFPPISEGVTFRSERLEFYEKFKKAVMAKAAFRKGNTNVNKAYDRIKQNLLKLELMR